VPPAPHVIWRDFQVPTAQQMIRVRCQQVQFV